ncbi:MAG TPA: SMP-30/gluconolactonase/LRE family protein [Xanthobacteraceae bacterium]|jgi:sugar lactone lactonase YvrE|nr:SMP-30/gluconolactonase/LRE family protein [Xanthobacteraceae bacterium]
MTRCGVVTAAIGLALGVWTAAPAGAFDRGNVDVLTVLPDVTPGQPSGVEGLTVGPDGNIYTTSFGFNTKGALTGPAALFVIRPDGKLVRQVLIAGSTPHMLGLGFNPVNKFLLILDFFAGKVLNVDPMTGNSSVFMTLSPPPANGLNALTFDKLGNVYVSDSFAGVIWKTGPNGGTPTPWSTDPLLRPGTGLTPPFGANGIEFNNAGTVMYVANTAFHQIIQIPINPNGTAGTASIFITGINAPDGIAIDKNDNLWVCANQEDDVIVLDKTGKVIAKLGDFNGIDDRGVVRGLLFPASPAFSLDGKTLYVSNLTLFLPFAGAQAAVDSPWTLKVKHYSVAKLRAVIPSLDDDER